ncbi:MAG: glycosyltransferase family 39 protein [Candidatus Rokubacteria bacterium]|nr:glycosyltransferase family 39 protein [Candidatus Rokubacteria bacterium]
MSDAKPLGLGRSVVAALAGVSILAAVGLTAFRTLRTFPGFSITGDALLYGELARNLLAGRGFVSDFIYPVSLAYPFLQGIPQPHTLYGPGYPAVLAGFFAAFGADDLVIVAANLAIFVLMLPVVFVLARRLFGPAGAWLATLLLTLDKTVVASIQNGGTEVLSMGLVLVGAILVVEAPRAPKAAAAGVVFGLAYLTRPNLASLAPFVLLHLWRLGSARMMGPFLAGGLVVAAPWLVRTWVVTGQPLFSLYLVANLAFDSPAFPGLVATFGTLTPRGLEVMVREFPVDLLQKLRGNLLYYVRQAFFTVNPVLMASFVVAVFSIPSTRRSQRLLVDLLGAWLVATIVVASLIAKEPRYLAPFAPVIVVIATGWVIENLSRLEFDPARRRALVGILAVALVGLPLVKITYDWTLRPAPARFRDPNIAAVGRLTDREDVIVSDIGRGLTWYLRRRTLQAPIDRQTLDRIDREILPVSAIYLSGAAATRWRQMFGQDGFSPKAYAPDRFMLVEAFADGGLLYRRRGTP